MKNVEQELKMELSERDYRILAQKTDALPVLQTNFYFAFDGMPSDMMVRVRRKAEDYLLCYKKRLSDRDGVTVCDEREHPLTAEHARYILQRGVTPDEMRKLLGVQTVCPLQLVGQLDTLRTSFVLCGWHLELDKNSYLGRCDYELECENNDVTELDKLKNYLYYTFGIIFRPSRPKVQRFFEALGK